MNGLAEILRNDNTLDDDRKAEFLSFAGFFDSDLLENLYKTSIDLNVKYKTDSPSSWMRFLKHPSVKKYIEGFRLEQQQSTAGGVLAMIEKPTDAIRMQKALNDMVEEEDNHNYVVFFMPQKDYGI